MPRKKLKFIPNDTLILFDILTLNDIKKIKKILQFQKIKIPDKKTFEINLFQMIL